ncbi:MAG: methyltransferase domain-containing protein [Bacteroidia bacterium]
MKTAKEIEQFYDGYVERQVNLGINPRHRSIQRWLKQFGLKPHHRVLEIGCGVGTQTELLLRYLGPQGFVTAMDISPRSIEVARQRLSSYKNAELIAADATDYDFSEKYDMIVMPDVIEHIPVDLHYRLFEKLSAVLKDEGKIIIHIPNPYYLEWVHKNEPELLQVIDQPIFTDILVKNVYPHGLYIHSLKTYDIWVEECDYQIIELRHYRPGLTYHRKPTPAWKSAVKFLERVKLKLQLVLGLKK